jgi:V8-like Glu-specific endopeptidase
VKRLLLVSLALACGPADPTGAAASPVLGGAPDATDDAVVALLIFSANGPQDDSECTGTVVSPHVVLTAAHCLSPDVAGPIDHVSIFLGDDSTSPTQLADPSLFVDVAETDFDPAFSATGTTHDVGVVVAASELSPAPVPMNRDSFGQGDVGRSVRVVGYGESTGADPSTAGARLSADATIFSVDDEHLGLDDVICFGDSGGPTLLTKDGVEYVAGIHSFGPPGDCIGIGEDTRVDRYVSSFVAPVVDRVDPGFLPGGCDASGGSGEPALVALALGVAGARRRARK